MQTHLQVGFANISLQAFINCVKGGGFYTLGASAGFFASKNPLSGSFTKNNPKRPAAPPTIPTIANAHLHPIYDINSPVREERAPPI
jgi:hypothetical protein